MIPDNMRLLLVLVNPTSRCGVQTERQLLYSHFKHILKHHLEMDLKASGLNLLIVLKQSSFLLNILGTCTNSIVSSQSKFVINIL